MGIIQSQFNIGRMIIEIKRESKRQENERELAKLYEEQPKKVLSVSGFIVNSGE